MSDFAHRSIFLLMAVVPFGLAAVLSALVFFGGAGQFVGHDLAYYGLPHIGKHLPFGIICFALFTGVMVAIYVLARKNDWSVYRWALILSVVSLFARLAMVCLFWGDSLLFSDNGFAWLRAIGEPSPEDYHWTIPSWMNYSLFLRPFALLFGKGYGVDLAAGAVFDGAATFLIALVANRMTERKVVAVLAAAFHALNPALVAYSLSGTPEHFAIAFFLAATCLFCRMTEADTARGMFAAAVPCGLVLGLGTSIKSIFPLMGAVMLGTVLLGGGMFQDRKHRRGRVYLLLCALAVVFIVQTAVVRGMTTMTEFVFDVKLSDKQSISHMLVVGLNRQGEGQLHIGGLSRTVDNCLRAGMSMEEASREGRRRVIDDWRGHCGEIPGFFMRKFIWGWQDFNRPCTYLKRDAKRFLEKQPDARSGFVGSARGWVYRAFTGALSVANALIYFCMMVFGTCAAFRCAMDKGGKSTVAMFAALMIVGFFFMLAVIEGQSRYKCLILPFVFIFAARFVSEVVDRMGDYLHAMWLNAMPVRFLVVGAWNFIVGYLVFVGLYWAFSGVWPDWMIVVIANVVGITNAFISHRWITYRSAGVWWREYLRFYVVYGIQALLNVALIYVFVTRAEWNGYAVQFVISAVLTVLSYWLHKVYSFRKGEAHEGL